MTIAPVVTTVTVKAPPARAFDLFTTRMGDWWPKGRTISKSPHAAIVVEPRVGGRWFERDADGAECDWGEVLAWEPPGRLLLGWRLNTRFEFDPDLITEVELSFEPTPQGGTRVRLEHRDLERFGADAEKLAGQLGGGWGSRIADFQAYADTQH